MRLNEAEKWEEDPNIKSFSTNINGEPANIYRYHFSSLAFNGIQIASPSIEMTPQQNFGGGSDVASAPLVLGIGALRELHLYIAYRSQTLYMTSAEAH